MVRQTFRARVTLFSMDGVCLGECDCLLETDAAPFSRTIWGGSLSRARDLAAGRYQMCFPNRRVREVELGALEGSERRFNGIGTLPMP
jgi:hypothetical protein